MAEDIKGKSTDDEGIQLVVTIDEMASDELEHLQQVGERVLANNLPKFLAKLEKSYEKMNKRLETMASLYNSMEKTFARFNTSIQQVEASLTSLGSLPLKLDTRIFDQQIKQLKKDAAMDYQVNTVAKVTLDTEKAESDLLKFKNKISSVNEHTATLLLDTDNAKGKLTYIKGAITGISSQTAILNFDSSDAQSQMTELEKRLSRLNMSKIKLGLDIDFSQLNQLQNMVGDIRYELEELQRQAPKKKPKLTLEEVRRLSRGGTSTSYSLDPDIDTDKLAKEIAKALNYAIVQGVDLDKIIDQKVRGLTIPRGAKSPAEMNQLITDQNLSAVMQAFGTLGKKITDLGVIYARQGENTKLMHEIAHALMNSAASATELKKLLDPKFIKANEAEMKKFFAAQNNNKTPEQVGYSGDRKSVV